ncbi:TVP38/TMEM64 family protein [Pseudocolwellia agarivorans]|uniref:TVP38/TMEM64 family protein n=1 Tax=Pseudocolwellia agarivorans TaxID=1911682 RepID=UPI000984F7F4|nr:VTT domain-containing protein [Pseudocolwellia agarivorans]
MAISILVALYALLSITLFTQESFQTYLLSFTPTNVYSTLLLLTLLSGLSCIGVPRQVIAFTCGYFFGVALGVTYATFTVTLAAYITYKLASLFQHSYIAIKYKKQLVQLNNFLSVKTFSKTLIIRLLPVGSNFLTNILAGIANVPLSPYILGSFVGFIPQMMIFSLAGSGVKLAESTHIIAAVILFIIASLLGWRLHKSNNTN